MTPELKNVLEKQITHLLINKLTIEAEPAREPEIHGIPYCSRQIVLWLEEVYDSWKSNVITLPKENKIYDPTS